MVEHPASTDTIHMYMCTYVRVILHKVVHTIHLSSIRLSNVKICEEKKMWRDDRSTNVRSQEDRETMAGNTFLRKSKYAATFEWTHTHTNITILFKIVVGNCYQKQWRIVIGRM